jgi:hypothetical protein
MTNSYINIVKNKIVIFKTNNKTQYVLLWMMSKLLLETLYLLVNDEWQRWH